MDLRVRFDHIDHVLEVHRAVTLHLKLLGVRLADGAGAAHVDEFWENFVLRRVDHGKRMDWNQYFVAVAVDSHGVVVVLVLIEGGRELDVDLLGDARRDHPLLLVADLEVVRLWGQDVEALGRGRVVDQPQLHRVRFIRLEAGELDDRGRGAEDAVGAHRVVGVLLRDRDRLVRLRLADDAPLNLDLVLTVRGRLVLQTLLEVVAAVELEAVAGRLARLGGTLLHGERILRVRRLDALHVVGLPGLLGLRLKEGLHGRHLCLFDCAAAFKQLLLKL